MPLFDSLGREIVPLRKHHRVLRTTKPKRRPKSEVVPRLVEVLLAARHNVSGTLYGPGTVKVPRKIASVLLEGERRAAATDANFAGTRACIVGPGATRGGFRVREVAPEYFDITHLSTLPFGVVDKAGLFASN